MTQLKHCHTLKNTLTFFSSLSIIVHGLPLFQNFDSRITRHVKFTCDCTSHSGVYFSHGDRRIVFLKCLSDFLILWCKLLAVATPVKGGKKVAGVCTVKYVIKPQYNRLLQEITMVHRTPPAPCLCPL